MKANHINPPQWRHLGVMLVTAVIGLFVAGCSGSESPDNLEPVIEMLPATGITRTEAIVTARIDNRGPGHLSFVRFHYGESGNIDHVSEATDPEASILTLALKDLKPGTSYSCYAEGGTSTATLRSATISFKTMPNSLPTITAAEPLSTGPVGIIIGFEIVEDGGEPILEAGCEISDAATGEKRIVALQAESLPPGYYRLPITGLTVNTRYQLTTFATNSIGRATGAPLDHTTGSSFMLQNAGVLSELLGNRVNIECLTISGEMNGSDFRYLRMLLGAPLPHGVDAVESSVKEADLTDVRIVEGGETYDDRRYTVADQLTTGLFSDCINLHSISLPSTATKMARDAFARCTALESLTVPAAIVSLLPSADCTALKAIEVSKANPNYGSVDGVLFDSKVTEMLWFPLGKTGQYTLPSTIAVIGDNAFAGTSITSLVIPASVTTIRRGAFAGSSLLEITLPDNLTNISEGMFQGCESLATVRLGSKTELIGNFAFDKTSLCDLYVGATLPPYVSPDAFVNGSSTIAATCTLHVPKGCKKLYRNHSRWKEFTRIEEF